MRYFACLQMRNRKKWSLGSKIACSSLFAAEEMSEEKRLPFEGWFQKQKTQKPQNPCYGAQVTLHTGRPGSQYD